VVNGQERIYRPYLVSFSYLLIQFEALWSSRPGGFNILLLVTGYHYIIFHGGDGFYVKALDNHNS